MKTKLSSIALLCAVATTAFSQGLAAPGPEHKLLAGLAGTWAAETKIWHQPGQPPMVLKGTMKNELILGGRFLRSHAKAGPVERLVIHGYDRRHKRYTTTGFDSGGTYSISTTGTYDAAKKTLTMRGKDEAPGGMTRVYEFVTRFIDKDRYVTEFYVSNKEGTKRFKMAESTAVRKRAKTE